MVHIRQYWSTVEISQDDEANVGLDGNFEFDCDTSSED